MDLSAVFEMVRSGLSHIPIPLWMSVAVVAGLLAYFIEERAITRFMLWLVLTIILFLLLYFA